MATTVMNVSEATECLASAPLEPKEFNAIFDSTGKIEDLLSENSQPSETQNTTKNVDSELNNEIKDSQENNQKNPVLINKSRGSSAKKKYRNFLDSDSEEDENVVLPQHNGNSDEEDSPDKRQNNELPDIISTAKSRKCRRVVDSDSDDEDKTIVVQTIGNDSQEGSGNENDTIVETSNKTAKSKISQIVDSESESDNDSDNSSQPPGIRQSEKLEQKSRFKTLVDTDSEDEIEGDAEEGSFNEGNASPIAEKPIEKSAKKKTGSARAAKDDAMRQIHSETQRLIRSSAISLPYHRPKQRTLQDFLNRKKFIPVLPRGLSTAAKVRMSSEIVGRVLKEKEKEAELFYKSSDSEDDEKIARTPAPQNTVEVPSSSTCTVADEIPIEETQKIMKNDLQNVHNKKEIIKQGSVDIGVPRKLFTDETQESLEKEVSTENEENMNREEDDVDGGESIPGDLRKKTKETKNCLRDGNAPRKLFPSDYDEGVVMPSKDSETSILVNAEAPSSELRKEKEADSDNIDEGIHSLSKTNEVSSSSECDGNDFVLKLPDSELPESEISREIEGCATKNIALKSIETSNIGETPFMSSKEYAKLNEKEKSSKNPSADSDEDSAFVHVHGLPLPDIDDHSSASKKSSLKNKVLSGLSSDGPKLRGTPGMIIDFSTSSKPDKEGVKSLVDRFMRHSAVNKAPATGSPVTVLHTEKTAEGLKIIEETLPYKIPVNDAFMDKELQKPGAKYKRLKLDLIEKMAKKRGEEWELKEQREKDENRDDIEGHGEESDVELVDEELQDSEESEPEEEEDEEEEDDVRIDKPKKRKSRAFADEEAEVSGDEENDEEEEEEDEDEAMELNEEVDEDDDANISLRVDNDDETDDNLSDQEESTEMKKPKRPSRIIKPFDEDSNSQPEVSSENSVGLRGSLLERTKTDVDMFAPDVEKDDWSSDAEADFPPSQILPRDQADARSQVCKTPLTSINVLRFVSPITQLTALNSCSESPRDSPASQQNVSSTSQRVSGSFASKTPISIKESPILCDNEKRLGFQKKLFEDPAGTVNDEELMGLCSGKFTSIDHEENTTIDPIGISHNRKVTETQLLGVCSGSFSSQNTNLDSSKDKFGKKVDVDSQDVGHNVRGNDDEALKETNKNDKPSGSLQVYSSSENEDSQELDDRAKTKVLRKKKVQKLELSDDDDDDKEFSDEEIDDILEEDADEKFVDYDSEENEVVVVPKKDIKKVAAGFLEAEAELSESEWGSEDEDEKDLDRLELEEGDEEEIDENQMRDQLGKIHMRQVQDDDQREVRMLQELLFDDGDLHTDGGGRERKFRWKNIDQLGDDDNVVRRTDGDENGDPLEDENELDWRKERIEREKFIEDKMKLSSDEVTDELEADSQVFKLGIMALKRSKNSQSSQKEPEPVVTKPIVPRTVVDLVDKPSFGKSTRVLHKAVTRGSFLARGDECLARLAVHIKHSSETTIVARKNPRSFVFTHISPSTAVTNEKEEVNSTIEHSPADSKTRKRKLAAGVTPRSTKKAKVDVTRSTGKKLF